MNSSEIPKLQFRFRITGDTMRGSISIITFYTVYKINLCLAAYDYSYLSLYKIDDKVRISCAVNQDCEEAGLKNFECVNHLCNCTQNTTCRTQLFNSSIVTKLYQNCTDSSQCNIIQSHCNKETNTCECNENSVSSEDNRRCLNESKFIGSPCEENLQCRFLNAVCKQHKCCCPDDMHADKGICFKNVDLNLPCQRDEECSITDFSSCKSNKCTCNEQYIKSKHSSKCLPKSRYLQAVCSEEVQCTSSLGSGATCGKDFCQCNDLYHYKANIHKCVLDARLGETCGDHSDCHQPGGEKSRLECIIGVCKCQPAYYEDEGFCVLNSANGWLSFNLRDLLPYVISYIIFYMII